MASDEDCGCDEFDDAFSSPYIAFRALYPGGEDVVLDGSFDRATLEHIARHLPRNEQPVNERVEKSRHAKDTS